MLKKYIFILFKIISIAVISIILLGLLLIYIVTYHNEYRNFSSDEPIWKFDGAELISSFTPIGYSRKIAFSYPYSTLVHQEPYAYEIIISVFNQDIKSISFIKIARELPNGKQIDFWSENIDGKGGGWSHNPVVVQNHYFEDDEIMNFRRSRRIEIDRSKFNENYENSTIPNHDYFTIMFTPVNIDFNKIEYFVLKIEIIFEYVSGETVIKEIEYMYTKKIDFEDWHNRID